MASLCAAMFLVSASVLALELVLMRVLSISSWHHYSYMVISVALLGFGASGVVLTIADRWIRPRWRTVAWLLCLGLAAAVPASHIVASRVPLNVLELLWDPWQSAYLALVYLAMFVPFLLGGAAVGLCLVANARDAGRLYFFNLLGSGTGAAAAVLMMFDRRPVEQLLVVAATACVAGLVLVAGRPWWRGAVSVVVGAALVITFGAVAPLEQPISPFKALPQYEESLGAVHERTQYGPLGRLDVVASPNIHLAAGLSLDFLGELPPQKVLLTDGDAVTAIPAIAEGDQAAYLDYLTSALPYHLLGRPRVCILGAGGGTDVAQAVFGERPVEHVTAVELNPEVLESVRAASPEMRALFDRPDVDVRTAEARFFLESTDERFDLVQLSLLDSFTASSAGLYALSESHLYTVEAVGSALGRLRPGGILSITRWLRTPPRDVPKMIATLVEAMRAEGGAPPEERIIAIRGMYTATILASADSFTPAQRGAAREFARQRGFDLVYLPHLGPDEANRHHHVEEPAYWRLARDLVEGDAAKVEEEYPYNIVPATDDRPFFFDFFLWRSMPDLMERFGTQWRALTDWGYLLLAASLAQTVVLSAMLVLLPAWLLGRRSAARRGRWTVAAYFALLGLAYIFLEMGFIARLTLLLGNPIYAAAVVLASFLVASGLGSLASGRWFPRPERALGWAWLGIAVGATAVLALLAGWSAELFRLPLAARLAAILVPVGAMAFFMGMPFPSGLRIVDRDRSPLVPWAWAVNGFASVVGAVGGTMLAMSAGFFALVAVAVALYALALVVGRRMARLAAAPAL